VSDNRILRKKSGPEWEGAEGGWNRLYNEGLCTLYVSPNMSIIGVIKSRMMIQAGV